MAGREREREKGRVIEKKEGVKIGNIDRTQHIKNFIIKLSAIPFQSGCPQILTAHQF